MNKQEMVDALSVRLNESKAHTGDILDAIFATDGVIPKALKKGDKVQIAGFGNFETRKRAARQGRNPQTGATIQIKASRVAAFRPAKALKDLVNKKQ